LVIQPKALSTAEHCGTTWNELLQSSLMVAVSDALQMIDSTIALPRRCTAGAKAVPHLWRPTPPGLGHSPGLSIEIPFRTSADSLPISLTPQVEARASTAYSKLRRSRILIAPVRLRTAAMN
jgi:hypothetical protein